MKERADFTTLAADPVKRDQENYIEGVTGLDDALAERPFSRPASGEKQVISWTWNSTTETLTMEVAKTAEA